MKHVVLTAFNTYTTAYEFLGQYYDTVQNDTLGAVLAGMRLQRETKLPVNPAMQQEWLATAGTPAMKDGAFTKQQAYDLMAEFLRRISAQIGPPGLTEAIVFVALHEHDAGTQERWEEAIELARGKYREWEG